MMKSWEAGGAAGNVAQASRPRRSGVRPQHGRDVSGSAVIRKFTQLQHAA
jgi:hypothetical protein